MNTSFSHILTIYLSLYIYRSKFLSCCLKEAEKKTVYKTRMTMRCKGVTMVVVLVLVMAWTVAGFGEGKLGASCGSTFFSALVQLIPCRAAVAPFSPIPPSDGCCNALKSLGQPCLCVLINGPPISGVDRNMAMLLPDKCSMAFEPCEIMKK
ncbi:hypothetical protein LINPERHAP2_LOCUS14476 [Linum perenne]